MKRIVDWFEHGDLVPLAVIISVAHYGPVLAAHGENLYVAWAVGVLIDLLHFRSVRYAFSSRTWLAGMVAAATTVMAMGYHLRFYGGDWLLALPIPIGIAILAWHASEKERGGINGQLAVVHGQLAERDSRLEEAGRQLQEAESQLKEAARRVQEFESQLQEAARRVQEADRKAQEADKQVKETEMQWSRLNPLAQDVVRMVMTKRGSQADIARRHEVSESKVSRIKAELNGGG
jgi:uncharacterized membrane protein